MQLATVSETGKDLPVELWRLILAIAFKGTPHCINIKVLRKVRRVSWNLRYASNIYISRFRMCESQICAREFRTTEPAKLVSVTAILNAANIGNDLLRLSHMRLNITTLTLGSAKKEAAAVNPFRYAALKDLDSSGKPLSSPEHTPESDSKHDHETTSVTITDIDASLNSWQNSLHCLSLDGCKLTACKEHADGRISATWQPKFPELLSLSLEGCELESLDMSQCRKLQFLGLAGNTLLQSVNLSHVNTLRDITCIRNPNLAVLGLSCCAGMNELKFQKNHSEFHVKVSGGNTQQVVHEQHVLCQCNMCQDKRLPTVTAVTKVETEGGVLSSFQALIKMMAQHICCFHT